MGRRVALQAALLALLLLAPVEARPQTALGTDIWVFPLSGTDPNVETRAGLRITNRPGYDNQPHFPPGERLVLYTVIDSLGQADIWSYDLMSREARNVTRSAPESEYSAAVMPSLARFSAIRVEADSTQRLWSFESGGTNPEVLLHDIQPVGYHAWIDEDRVALFILGSPATLQIASMTDGTAESVAENIGRSLHRIPERETISFVQWAPHGIGWITEFDPESGETLPLAPLLPENEFYAWGHEGTLITGQGSKLFRWALGISEEWEEIADLDAVGVRGITRIAVSPEGGWIAVVGVDIE